MQGGQFRLVLFDRRWRKDPRSEVKAQGRRDKVKIQTPGRPTPVLRLRKLLGRLMTGGLGTWTWACRLWSWVDDGEDVMKGGSGRVEAAD